MFAPRHDLPLADLVAEHRALREDGAVHYVAALDGRDVGLLTIELTSPVPRLCPDGQHYIGPTATLQAGLTLVSVELHQRWMCRQYSIHGCLIDLIGCRGWTYQMRNGLTAGGSERNSGKS